MMFCFVNDVLKFIEILELANHVYTNICVDIRREQWEDIASGRRRRRDHGCWGCTTY